MVGCALRNFGVAGWEELSDLYFRNQGFSERGFGYSELMLLWFCKSVFNCVIGKCNEILN